MDSYIEMIYRSQDTNSGSHVLDFPTSCPAITAFHNSLLGVGGWKEEGDSEVDSAIIVMYLPQTGQWEKVGELPTHVTDAD